MPRIIYLIISLLSLLALGACGNGKFDIEGTLTDAGTQNLRFIYVSDGAVNSAWTPSVGGKFAMQGRAKDLTVVYIYSSKMKFITHVAVKNGEKIEINGAISDNYKLDIKGSKINDQWHGFIRQNAADFAGGNNERLDKAIALFVSNNPDNVVSTLLLTCDYSDIRSPQAAQLLSSISEDARPSQLTDLYGSEMQAVAEKEASVASLSLRNDKDSLELFDTKKHPKNLFYFWYFDTEKRTDNIRALRNFVKKHNDISVADILLRNDTLGWKSIVKADSSSWRHYRAIAGTVDRTIEGLNVKGDNFIIVADSAGRQLYRGFSVDEAMKVAAQK